MIEFQDVSHAYENTVVLSHLSLTLSEKRIGITGPNGSGKSTLIRMMNGLITPTRGEVLIDGRSTRTEVHQIRQHTGFIFADPTIQILMPTVVEDVEFSLRRTVKNRKDRHAQALHHLAQFGLQDFADRSPHELSGGQQQLLAIAAIMATAPTLVVADEPTALLDLRNTYHLQKIFRDMPAQLVMVSHNFEVLRELDRVLVIDQGQIVADGDPGESLATYEAFIRS